MTQFSFFVSAGIRINIFEHKDCSLLWIPVIFRKIVQESILKITKYYVEAIQHTSLIHQ